MRTTRLTIAAGACALLLLGYTLEARAQDPEDDGLTTEEREARSLFDAGRAAFSAGRFDEAYERFMRAYELAPRARATLVYNLASAADRAGRDDAALAHYREFLEFEPEAQNRSFVEARIRVLEARTTPSGSDEPEPEATDEPELMPDSAQETVGEGSGRLSETPTAADPDPTAAAVLFAIAGAAGIAAIVTGAVAWGIQGELEGACANGVCAPELRSRGDELDAYALATDVLAASSAAFAIGGVVALIVTYAGGSEDVQAACGPRGCTLGVRF